MKIKKDMAVRCANSLPMTLHRPLQQLLEDQVEHRKKLKQTLLRYAIKDRFDYLRLGYDVDFEQKLRHNYESRFSTVLRA